MDNISEIQNKYSDFLSLLVKKIKISNTEETQARYVINQDGSIDVFCNDVNNDKEEENSNIYLNSNISYIPPNTRFHGNLNIFHSLLEKIGKNVIINGSMKIYTGSSYIINEGLYAKSFCVYDKNLEILPNNVEIENDLTLYYCNIKEFGKNIKAKSLIVVDNDLKKYSIKNMENLDIENLIIYSEVRLNNINKIKNLKTIEYNIFSQKISNAKKEELINYSPSPEKTKVRLDNNVMVLDHEMTEDFLKTIKRLGYLNIYHDYLNFKSPNSLCSKLINEEYDLITEEEIKKYSNIKEFLIGENKIPVNITDYCVGPKGILYLKQLGYKLTKNELEKIRIKGIENKYLNFFEVLDILKEQRKIEYRINKNDSIDVFCNDKTKEAYIYLYDTIHCIPSRTTFYGNVSIDDADLVTIENKIIVKGYLNIEYCNDLESIGEGLCAEKIYISNNISLKILPDNTKAEKIQLKNTGVQKFGKNTKTESLEIIYDDYKNCPIKNMENLEVKKLIIHKNIRLKNINKIRKLKMIEYHVEYSKLDSYRITLEHEITEDFLKSIKKPEHINIYYNYLDFKSPNSFCSKLINEEYDLITKEDIQGCVLLNNKEVLICKNKIPIRMIDYCVGPKGISYLKKLGYEFTRNELVKIIDPQIKSYYEKELMNQELKIRKNPKEKIRLIKRDF